MAVITADSVGFFLFSLFALVVSILIYVSEKHAPTEARKYVYSPTYSPRSRTPKRSFAVLALVISFSLAVLGFNAYLSPPHPVGPSSIPPQQMQTLHLIAQALLWIAIGACVGGAGLFAWTTRPLEDSAANEDERQPPELHE